MRVAAAALHAVLLRGRCVCSREAGRAHLVLHLRREAVARAHLERERAGRAGELYLRSGMSSGRAEVQLEVWRAVEAHGGEGGRGGDVLASERRLRAEQLLVERLALVRRHAASRHVARARRRRGERDDRVVAAQRCGGRRRGVRTRAHTYRTWAVTRAGTRRPAAAQAAAHGRRRTRTTAAQ